MAFILYVCNVIDYTKMNNYRAFLHYLSTNNLDRVFYNENDPKAKEVFIEIFKKSKSTIRLFSGSLSNKDVSNTSEYIQTLSSFIEDGGELKILLNRFEENREGIINADLFKRLALYQKKEMKVVVRRTSNRLHLTKDDGERQEVNLCVGDNNIYRLETNIENREATCNFNSEELATQYITVFDSIFDNDNLSSNINLIELLNF